LDKVEYGDKTISFLNDKPLFLANAIIRDTKIGKAYSQYNKNPG
jgi:hypothetical protein